MERESEATRGQVNQEHAGSVDPKQWHWGWIAIPSSIHVRMAVWDLEYVPTLHPCAPPDVGTSV